MIHSSRFTVVLDTNVIYPLVIRDLLFWFAHYELYTVKWSQNIFTEWNRVMERKDVSEEQRSKRMDMANRAFPDAMVSNYEPLIEKLELPDKHDRHVLAAAIKTNANLIVTENLKDFPEDYVSGFGIKVKSPDDFLTDTIDLNQKQCVEIFRELVMNRTNPDMDEYAVLDALRKAGCKKTADYLHSQL